MDNEPIQYDDGGFGATRRQQGQVGLIGLLLKAGFAKSPEQANKILIGLLILAIVVGVGAWFIF